MLPCCLASHAELTFIVFDASETKVTEADVAAADAPTEASAAAVAVRSADELTGMCGDVNIFMLDADHCDDYVAVSGATAAAAAAPAASDASAAGTSAVDSSVASGAVAAAGGAARAPVTAEIMVMMADAAYRRKGLAVEAVLAMMRYGACDTQNWPCVSCKQGSGLLLRLPSAL